MIHEPMTKIDPVTAGKRNTQSAVRSFSAPTAKATTPIMWQNDVALGPNEAIATSVTQMASKALKKSQNCSTFKFIKQKL